MLGVLDEPEIQEWLDEETGQFVETLSEPAGRYHDWLTNIRDGDDLFDVGAEMRLWWDEQIRPFRSGLLTQHRSEEVTAHGGWHEDFQLESRRHLAFISNSTEQESDW